MATQYSCHENPMDGMKRQKGMTPEDERPGQKVSQQVAKVIELQLHHQSFEKIFRVDSVRIDWVDVLAVQGTLKILTCKRH